MILKATFATIGAVVLAFSSSTKVQAASLLVNGSFETPFDNSVTLKNGNNFVLPQGWTVSTSATGAQTASLSNLADGTATGTAYNGGVAPTLNPYDGMVAFDGDGASCVLYEDFTPTTTSLLNVQLAFGGRDGDSNSTTTAGSSWSIGTVNGTTYTPLYTSGIYKPTPGTGSATGSANRPDWSTVNFTPSYIFTANSTYRFVINLDNPDHVDAVLLTPVPEPSTLAAVGLGAGLLGWVGFKRRRRA